MLYLDEEKLIITVSCDSIIRIYECEDGKEIEILRELRGGHKNAEISALSYCKNILSLVTGSSNGLVSLWNFKNSKLENVFLDDVHEITGLCVAFPYKIIISMNILGMVSGFKIGTSKKE